MNKIIEVIEFTKQYLSTEETTDFKEVLAFTGPLSFDMDKIRKDLEKIWNFIGQNQAFPSKKLSLGTLVYDNEYNQYNYLQSFEEIICINLLLGLMIASEFVIEDCENFQNIMKKNYHAYNILWNLNYENMSVKDYYTYGVFLYERLYDRIFYLQPSIVDLYGDNADDLTSESIKTLLTYWFRKDVTEDEFPNVYEDFDFALNCYLENTFVTIISMNTEDRNFTSKRFVERLLATGAPFVDAIYFMGIQLGIGNRKEPLDLVKKVFLVKLKRDYEQEYPENKLSMS